MVTNISSKSELGSMASKLSSQAIELKSIGEDLRSFLSSIPNYKDINVSGPASILGSNAVNIATDIDAVSRGIKGYITDLEAFDVYDFDVDAALNGDMYKNNDENIPVSGPTYVTPSRPSTPVYSDGSNNLNAEKNSNKDVSKVEKPVNNNKPTNLNNSISNNNSNLNVEKDNNVNNLVIDKVEENNTSNVQSSGNVSNIAGDTNSNTNNNSGNSSMVEMSTNDNVTVNEQVTDNVIDNAFSDDVYVNDDSGYIGNTNNVISDNVNNNSNNNSSGNAIPGILGGLGAAAVVGLGAVGGARVVKNMKENQEIDEDEEE